MKDVLLQFAVQVTLTGPSVTLTSLESEREQVHDILLPITFTEGEHSIGCSVSPLITNEAL